MTDLNIGINVRKIREAQNLSTQEFSKKIKISLKKIEKIEDNKLLPDLFVIKRICDKNCVNLNYLLNNSNVERDEELFGYFVELYENQKNRNIFIFIVMVLLIIIVLILICELIII